MRPPLLAVIAGSAVLCALLPLSAQPAEPPMDERVLADGDSESTWTSAEATMEPDDTYARTGRAMRFHIDVNHETGEVNYPIGWPRTYLAFPEGERDVSGWDFLDFWIYAESSRETLPSTPLGLTIRCPDKSNAFSATLGAVRLGEWVHFRFPMSSLPDPTNCAAIQFFVSESNYRHGDVLDFWIDDLKLLRYAEPTIITVQPLNQVAFRDQPVLRIAVDLTGLDEGATARVEVGLSRDGEPTAVAAAELGAGVATIPLPLVGARPGMCQAWARVTGSDRTLTQPVRVVSSPWEAEEQ
ncbi:MAG: hypothetical protein AB7Y46_06220 [Armatimonadota bacterium]